MTPPIVASSAFFSLESLIPLAAFAFASVWTPGPNNMMLASSGATFGFRRSVPHALGVALGFPFMLFLLSLGLGELFKASALFRETLRWAGAALLLYLGWRIATASRASADGVAGRPFTFVEAAGFQWINPKAWVMAIGAASTFLDGAAPVAEAATAAGIFALAGLSSAHSWAAFGSALRRVLSSDLRLRLFNGAMGAMIAGCVVFLFLDDL